MAVSKKNPSQVNDTKKSLSQPNGSTIASSEELESLRTLLIGPEILGLAEARRRIAHLEHQIRDSSELVHLLLPVITELLSRKVAESGEMVASAIAPIIDETLRKKIQQDRTSIPKILAPIISDAIKKQIELSKTEIATALAPIISASLSQRISEASDEVAKALAPVMGAALREQIASRREEVVQALYPIMGSTLAKCLSESIRNLISSINQSIQNLLGKFIRGQKAKIQTVPGAPASKPYPLLMVGLALLGWILVSLGLYSYRNTMDHNLEVKIARALASMPEFSIYRLGVDVHRGTLQLSGVVPNEYLRLKAEQIARKVAPALKLNNSLRAIPADPILAAAEVQRVASILNEIEGVSVSASYKDGQVIVEGSIPDPSDAGRIARPFEQIQGVRTLTVHVQQETPSLSTRVYFDPASAKLKPTEMDQIPQVKEFIEGYPDWHLRIIGHIDRSRDGEENRQLALRRAEAVKAALISYGVEADRLQVVGIPEPPPEVNGAPPGGSSRCVRFELIEPVSGAK